MRQNHLTLDDLNILNCGKEAHTHLLKPAQFAYLTKHIAVIPRDDFSPLRYQLKLAEDMSASHSLCSPYILFNCPNCIRICL